MKPCKEEKILSFKYWGNDPVCFILSDYRMYNSILEYSNSKGNNRIRLG